MTSDVNYIELLPRYVFVVTHATSLIFPPLPSITWSLTSLPELDGAFLFFMLSAMRQLVKLYITRRNALVLAALMGKVVRDVGPSYRN